MESPALSPPLTPHFTELSWRELQVKLQRELKQEFGEALPTPSRAQGHRAMGASCFPRFSLIGLESREPNQTTMDLSPSLPLLPPTPRPNLPLSLWIILLSAQYATFLSQYLFGFIHLMLSTAPPCPDTSLMFGLFKQHWENQYWTVTFKIYFPHSILFIS